MQRQGLTQKNMDPSRFRMHRRSPEIKWGSVGYRGSMCSKCRVQSCPF